MDYIKSNKEAWEEAFERRAPGWCEDIIKRLREEEFPFLESEMWEELQAVDLKNKTIGQFCCNNGRELLAAMKLGPEKGIGFDIAENMVAWANDIALRTNTRCSFVSANILELDEGYEDNFDLIFFTIGAITWFQDLNLLFSKVSSCLKKGGILLISDMHPVTNMLAFQGEDNYDEKAPGKLVNSYFRQEPWEESNGKFYMSGKEYSSKTFFSYSHSFSGLVNSLTRNNLSIFSLREFQHDVSESLAHLNNTGIPLSYILRAKKL